MQDLFNELYTMIKERRENADPDTSYVAKLFDKGRATIARKVGEEGVETAVAALAQEKQDVVNESADLLFHLLILWAETGVIPDDVEKELRRRMGISGLDEKAARSMK